MKCLICSSEIIMNDPPIKGSSLEKIGMCSNRHFTYAKYKDYYKYIIFTEETTIEYLSYMDTSYFWKHDDYYHDNEYIGELPGLHLNFDKLNKMSAFL